MRKFLFLLFFVAFVVWNGRALADPGIAEIDVLSFGEFAVTSNSAQTITIPTNGTQTEDAGITKLLPGKPGVFRLSGFATAITVSASIADTTLVGPGSATFDVSSFTFDPIAMAQITDGSGNLILKVGATLTTRAGVNYGDGAYRGTYTLMISY